MGIQFQILGPLEVRAESVALPIGGPRQRALLAMLLLSANRVVSRDRLIDELLDGAPAGRAERMLRVQVSRLRGVLDPADGNQPRLVARPPGYLLRVEPGELDLQTFEELLADGHQALEDEEFERASQVLRRAESLWRGRPLADLEFERFARLEIERLDELRLTATEDRIDAELALGRHAMLVPQLESLVAEHPLRERPRSQLMLALYRCGRQADALASYRAGRMLLSDELALEPGPALRALERSILRQEPVLQLPYQNGGPVAAEAAVPPPAPPDAAPPDPDGQASPEPGRRASRVLGLRRHGVQVAAAAALVLAAGGAIVVVLTGGGARPLTVTANSVGMIDTASGALRAVVGVGGQPGGIAAGASAVWETDTANDLLIAIDPVTRATERIPVGRDPTGVAVGNGEVWVVNQLDRTVSEINPQALRQVGSYTVGNGPGPVAFGDGAVWVANTTDDTISRIDPSTGTARTIPLSGQPAGLAVSPAGVWVTNASTGQLLLLDPARGAVTQARQIGDAPAGVAVGSGSVWVADTADDTVVRFNPGTGAVRPIDVGQAPVGVAYGAGAVWAADSRDGTVARIDPRTDSVRLLPIGAAPAQLAIQRRQLWATILPGYASHLGGTLTFAETGSYTAIGDSLDPAQFAGVAQWQVLSLTNDGLVTYRRVGGVAGSTVVPDLATTLPTPTDDGRTYTFQLRAGIRYSNGTPVRPEDFRRELERVFRLGNGYPQSFYTGIVGGQACMARPSRCTLAGGVVPDDAADTVTFHLTAPDSDFLYKLAFPWAVAVPATTPLRSLGRSMPPATGPYETKSITPSSQLSTRFAHPLAFTTWTLVRNPRFHEWSQAAQPSGYPDRIVLRQGQDPERAVDAVERRQLDVLLPVPADRLAELATHYTGQFHSEPVGATFAPVMNTRLAPFDRVSVRRALNDAVDRRQVVTLAGGPLAAKPTCQILPPDLSGYRPYCPDTNDPSPSGSWQGPDIAKATQLIDASGTRGMKVTLVAPSPDFTNHTTAIGRYLVSLLDRLGYRASLHITPVQQYWPDLGDSRSRIQLGWFSWAQDYPGPADFLSRLLSCRAFLPANPNNLNNSEFCSASIDTEMQRASALEASDPGAASQAWSAIDRQITDQAPWLPLYNPRLNIVTSPRVGNYQYHPFFGLLLDQLWVR